MRGPRATAASSKSTGSQYVNKQTILQRPAPNRTHVNIPSPVNLSFGDLDDRVAAILPDRDRLEAYAVAGSHGEVRQEGDGGDQRCDEVEEAFLLAKPVRFKHVPPIYCPKKTKGASRFFRLTIGTRAAR